jgi:hypothetical protein
VKRAGQFYMMKSGAHPRGYCCKLTACCLTLEVTCLEDDEKAL